MALSVIVESIFFRRISQGALELANYILPKVQERAVSKITSNKMNSYLEYGEIDLFHHILYSQIPIYIFNPLASSKVDILK